MALGPSSTTSLIASIIAPSTANADIGAASAAFDVDLCSGRDSERQRRCCNRGQDKYAHMQVSSGVLLQGQRIAGVMVQKNLAIEIAA
jgi:hypothetical protein